MSPWLVSLVIGVAFGLLQYRRDARAGGGAAIAAGLRVTAICVLSALVLDAPAGLMHPVPSWVALDVSASWLRGGDTAAWRKALSAIAAAHAESIFAFGSSLRVADTTRLPADPTTVVRPAVDRALGRGHPLTVVTDGELDDPDALRLLTTGSRIVVVPHSPQRDVAATTLEVARAVVSGDTIDAKVGLVAGTLGSGAGKLTLMVDGKSLASAALDSMTPLAERVISLRGKVDAPEGHAVLRAIATARGDAEPRNDTIAVGIDVSRAAGAVFVSTSPDFDARYALGVLRGALSIPTRGFFRVAPGAWRADGSLAPVSESEVRQAVRDAPVVILHGDTSVFGSPESVTHAPMALLVPPTGDDGEWYAASAPSSPLAGSLSGLPWDSLPPLDVAPVPPRGQWNALMARLGRQGDTRVVIAGMDAPRRVVVVGSGLWRWHVRGGSQADAFTTIWGSIFDWLAAERADGRVAVPDERLLRFGEPVRWRRGSPEPSDSAVTVLLRKRGDSIRVDTLALHFPSGLSVVVTPTLAPGVYDAQMRGGSAVLGVNAARELLPRVAPVKAGAVGGSAPSDTAVRLRSAWWAYALVILLLCAEWIVRRRRGMR